MQRGIDSLRAAWTAVRRLALFSKNETKDDLATTALKFLLIPFYLSEACRAARIIQPCNTLSDLSDWNASSRPPAYPFRRWAGTRSRHICLSECRAALLAALIAEAGGGQTPTHKGRAQLLPRVPCALRGPWEALGACGCLPFCPPAVRNTQLNSAAAHSGAVFGCLPLRPCAQPSAVATRAACAEPPRRR